MYPRRRRSRRDAGEHRKHNLPGWLLEEHLAAGERDQPDQEGADGRLRPGWQEPARLRTGPGDSFLPEALADV